MDQPWVKVILISTIHVARVIYYPSARARGEKKKQPRKGSNATSNAGWRRLSEQGILIDWNLHNHFLSFDFRFFWFKTIITAAFHLAFHGQPREAAPKHCCFPRFADLSVLPGGSFMPWEGHIAHLPFSAAVCVFRNTCRTPISSVLKARKSQKLFLN